MKIDVLTLFPAMFAGPLDESIVKRARETGLVDLKIHNLRDWTHDRHKTVDDRPFGGGPGMLLKPEPLFEAIESLKREDDARDFVVARRAAVQPGHRARTGGTSKICCSSPAITKALTSACGRNSPTTNCPSAITC